MSSPSISSPLMSDHQRWSPGTSAASWAIQATAAAARSMAAPSRSASAKGPVWSSEVASRNSSGRRPPGAQSAVVTREPSPWRTKLTVAGPRAAPWTSTTAEPPSWPGTRPLTSRSERPRRRRSSAGSAEVTNRAALDPEPSSASAWTTRARRPGDPLKPGDESGLAFPLQPPQARSQYDQELPVGQERVDLALETVVGEGGDRPVVGGDQLIERGHHGVVAVGPGSGHHLGSPPSIQNAGVGRHSAFVHGPPQG